MPWNNQGNDKGGPPAGGPWGSSGGSGGNNTTPPAGGDQPNNAAGGPTSSGPANPWNKQKSGGGGKGGGPGGDGPDIEDFIRRGQARMRKMMPGGFGQHHALVIIALFVLGLWLISGFYRVQQDEQAIEMVFGRANPIVHGPGLGYNWPAPIGDVIKSRTGSENRIEIGMHSGQDKHGKVLDTESLMLTSDENIIDIKFVILWRINDPLKYEFNIRDQEHTITRAAESAIREVIAQTPIQTALTEGREEVSAKTRIVLQKMLDEYEAGVIVNGIELQAVSPPDRVIDAFSDVQRARQDEERLSNEAEAYRNSILPRAQGAAAQKKQEALAYKAEIVNRAQGDAARFKSVLQAYQQAKDVTTKRLYLETMESVLQRSHKTILDTSVGGVVPYLPLTDLSKTDLPKPAPEGHP